MTLDPVVTEPVKTPLLASDHPRKDPTTEDLLGYAPFAKMLAQSVLRGSPASGLVVGVYGEWGLGKTTLLNFVEHYANADIDDDAPIVVRFNPWWFSGREDLLRRFFKEFEIQVLRKRARSTKVRDALQKLGDAVAVVPDAWVATAGKFLTAATRLGQPADLVALREALVAALAAEHLRVIVLVDDIDRLLPAEMVDVFRLVRSVGDFPNVYYVLAFDREVVTKALTSECRTDGDRYLEKIIQVPFELPRPDSAELHGLFTRRLDELLSKVDAPLFDQRYWVEVFTNGIAPLLGTPRDVIRLLNPLAVLYPAVRGEVNVVDFVAIEALRVFVPDAYNIVRSAQASFVGFPVIVDHLKEGNRLFHEGWLGQLKENQQAVREIIVRLFPAVGSLLKSRGGVPKDAVLRKARRIASEHSFDTYFRYTLGKGLSRSAFFACLGLRGGELSATLRQWVEQDRDKLRGYLQMLLDGAHEGHGFDAPDMLAEILAVGDPFMDGMANTLSFVVSEDHLVLGVVRVLVADKPAVERLAVLQQALLRASATTAGRVLCILSAEHGRDGEVPNPPQERTLESASDLDAIAAIVRARMEGAVADGTLWNAPGHILLMRLYDWRRADAEPQMREAVAAWCSERPHFVDLMCRIYDGSGGRDLLDMKVVSDLLDLEVSAKTVEEALTGTGLDEKARHVFQVFVRRYAPIRQARIEEAARRSVLHHILGEIDREGWFPLAHKIRMDRPDDLALIDRLLNEKLLGHVPQERYMLLYGALTFMGDDPLAKAELRRCWILAERLMSAYKASDKDAVDLEKVTETLNASYPDLLRIELGCAAWVLQRMGHVRLSTNDDDGIPLTVFPNESVLTLKAETFVRAE